MSKWTWFVVLFSRMTLNLGFRVTYPFLPAIARGLGISFAQAGVLVAARSFVGLSGLIWAFLGDRKGYGWGMKFGLVLLFLGGCTVSISAGFSWALVGFVLIGLSKPIYDPSVQAFASSRTPYSRRARTLGLLEASWSGSWLVGIPLSGLLIATFGWRSPFVLISGAGLLAILLTNRLQEINKVAPDSSKDLQLSFPSRENTPPMGARPILILGVSLFMIFANENLLIVYGAWLEEHFHLQVKELGLLSVLVGVAELAGEFTVVFLVDRIGKRRAILGGLLLTGLSYVALPFCQSSIAQALLGLMFMFYVFEFTIVSIFPYVSELVPTERGKWLAFNYTALVVGRMVGALSGPWLWQRNPDISDLVIVSLVAQFLALVLLLSTNRTGGEQKAVSGKR